jgi:hypothetical protein
VVFAFRSVDDQADPHAYEGVIRLLVLLRARLRWVIEIMEQL